MEKVINEYLDKLHIKIENYFNELAKIDEDNDIEKIYDLDMDYELVFVDNNLKLKTIMRCKVDYVHFGEAEDKANEETIYHDDFEINSIMLEVFYKLEEFIQDKQNYKNDTYDEDER